MKIAMVGTGYVGLVTGTCFSEMGNDVICVDVDAKKIAKLESGVLPIYEPGLVDLVQANMERGSLRFTTEIREALETSELVFIAVGTPMGEDGSADLQYVLGVAHEIGSIMEHPLIVVDKSTVPVGTADRVRAAIQEELDNVFASGTKMVILLQDDHQLIHPEERGVLRQFLLYAQKRKIPFTSLHLTIQKRCTKLGGLLTGLEKLFYQEHAQEVIHLPSVKVFDRLGDMDAWIREESKTSRAKILAPYCWPWGGKDDDVTIPEESFRKRWNPGNTDQQAEALSNFTGTDDVYCIYTSQGLDLDNIAFIWWDDLRWDETKGSWVISLKENQDPRFQKAVREANLTENTPWLILLFKDMYYVMLSRARENLGIWFRDAATKKHVCEVLGLTPEN